jgi:hypothetical protein
MAGLSGGPVAHFAGTGIAAELLFAADDAAPSLVGATKPAAAGLPWMWIGGGALALWWLVRR